jgi:hypothetical protein
MRTSAARAEILDRRAETELARVAVSACEQLEASIAQQNIVECLQ